MKRTVIKRNAIRCKKCGDVIESKTVHDFKTCKCGYCSVDGGHEYLRRCGDLDSFEDLSIVVEEEYNACVDCQYWGQDFEWNYLLIGECPLFKCSQYGQEEACEYFKKVEDN